MGEVAVIGAGWLGAALARALPPPVRVTTRHGRWRDGEPPVGVRLSALDVCAPQLDVTALRDAEALVLCFAPGRDQDRRALYVEGTRRLLRARLATGRRLHRVVYVGSTSALPELDAWLDESCETWPDTERGRVQREAEGVVASSCENAGVPWIVLRMGGLYGPQRELDRIYLGRSSGPLPGDGMAPTNLIHLEDAVAALRAALAAPPVVTGIVHVVDDDHTPRREMYARIARARGVEPVRWADDPPADAQPRGKRVCNDKLGTMLGVRLRHREHRGPV